MWRLGTVGVIVLFSGVPYAEATRWHITQLTDNSDDDVAPEVSGSNVAWRRAGDIFVYDGSDITQLTDSGNAADCNTWDDCGPQIDGSTVVWSEFDGHDHEIFLAVPILPGDMNLDDQVNGLDVDPFVDAVLSEPFNPYADMNGDGVVTGLDVDPFVAALIGGGVQAIPEPSTIALLPVALVGLCGYRRAQESGPSGRALSASDLGRQEG